MTLDIGIIIGGTSPQNAPTVERVQQMRSEADAASKNITSDFELHLTFQISGPEWRPKSYGVRAGRLAADGKSLTVEIGVPEAFPSAVERDRFLGSAMRESVKKASDALTRRGFDWSLSPVHPIVDQILRRALEASAQEISWEPMVSGQDASRRPLDADQQDSGKASPVQMYSPGDSGLRYWEAWASDGKVTIHTGIVGDRGQVSEVVIRRGYTPRDVIQQLVRSQLDHGFKQVEEVDQSTLIVQYPPDHFEDMDHVLRVWDVVERLLNDELRWVGLGSCINVDYSSELTFTVVAVDENMAVARLRERLDREGVSDQSVIAVERSGEYVAVWPKDRRGARIAY